MEHYWFTHSADRAVSNQIRPGVRLFPMGLEDLGPLAAPPIHLGEKRARDKRFTEYPPDLRAELVRLARYTAGCRAFAMDLLEYCVSVRLCYACRYFQELGLDDVPELVSEDVLVARRALREYGDVRKLLIWGRIDEWRARMDRIAYEARVVVFKAAMGDPALSDELDDRLKVILGWIKDMDDRGRVGDYRVFTPKFES